MLKKRKQVYAAIFAILAGMQFVSVYIYRKVFFTRCIREIPFWQRRMDAYPELKRIHSEFKNDRGVILRGYFYCRKDMRKPVEDGKGTIILANGYLQSHEDYMEDIAYLAKLGFVVFGFDNMGCHESDGSRMMGLEQAVLDLSAAVRYVEEVTNRENDLFLYGHSMGAYACAVVLNDFPNIRRVLLRSGFYSPSLMIYDALSQTFGKSLGIMLPFIFLYRLLLFPSVIWKRAVCGIKKTRAQVYILHSEDDTVVPCRHSLYGRRHKFLKKENICTRLYVGRGHDIVRSYDAMRYYFAKERERLALAEKYRGEHYIPKQEIRKFRANIDPVIANGHDEKLLHSIGEFFLYGF